MPSILTQNYRTHLATELLSRLAWAETVDDLTAAGALTSDGRTTLLTAANTVSLYAFIGHTTPWPTEGAPPTPVDTPQETTYDYWRHMLFAKRVLSTDFAFVVPRIDWNANTVYTQYDDTTVLANTNFYVLVLDDAGGTPAYQVYKCLWNAGGANSTYQPTGIDSDPQTYDDGYVWQYLYSLATTTDDFLTDDWMPVYETSSLQAVALANPGTLPRAVPFVIVTPGANYNASVNAVCTLTGDGAGASVANGGIAIVGGTVQSVTLLSGGTGYTNVGSINIYQSGASLATARAIIPPYPNHGYDNVHELQAKHLMCVVEFYGDEGGKLTVNNDFRQIGLVVNPLLANGVLATDTKYKQTWDVTVQAGAPTYNPDDVVINTTKSPSPFGVVVDTLAGEAGKKIIRLTDVNVQGFTTPFGEGDTLNVVESSPSTVSADAVSNPELLPYTGEVLYVTQRVPVTRTADQTQEFKIALPFG
jgi:hypothetical protein